VGVEVTTDDRVAVVRYDAVLQIAEKCTELCNIGVWPGGPVARVNTEISCLNPCKTRLGGPDDVHCEAAWASYGCFAERVVVPRVDPRRGRFADNEDVNIGFRCLL